MFNPGDTAKHAPEFLARIRSIGSKRVPTPTLISGNSFDIISTAFNAGLVLNVISITERPPAINAVHKGRVSFKLLIVRTGIILVVDNNSLMCIN